MGTLLEGVVAAARRKAELQFQVAALKGSVCAEHLIRYRLAIAALDRYLADAWNAALAAGATEREATIAALVGYRQAQHPD